MTYPDRPLKGVVDSLGWGISKQDGSTAADLLPKVSATFEWIRLAQRIPVRIRLLDVPKDVKLRVGTTCSVSHHDRERRRPARRAPGATGSKAVLVRHANGFIVCAFALGGLTSGCATVGPNYQPTTDARRRTTGWNSRIPSWLTHRRWCRLVEAGVSRSRCSIV